MFLSKIRVNFRCNTHFCPFNITQRPHAHPIDTHKPSTAQVIHKVCHVPAATPRPCILEHRCAEKPSRKEGAKVIHLCFIHPSHRTAFPDAPQYLQKRRALHRPTHSTSSPHEEHSDRHRTALHFSTIRSTFKNAVHCIGPRTAFHRHMKSTSIVIAPHCISRRMLRGQTKRRATLRTSPLLTGDTSRVATSIRCIRWPPTGNPRRAPKSTPRNILTRGCKFPRHEKRHSTERLYLCSAPAWRQKGK